MSGLSVIFPAYIYPTSTAWAPLTSCIAQNPGTTFNVVINPASGPGSGTYPNSDYVSAIAGLNTASNVNLLGYVNTAYASRVSSAVIADVATYAGWSNYTGADIHLDGIFFDAVPSLYTDTSFTFLTAISQAARSYSKSVYFNPGTAMHTAFYALADNVNAIEVPGSQYTQALITTIPANYRDNSSAIIYSFTGTAADQSQIIYNLNNAGMGGVYVNTNGGFWAFGDLWTSFCGALAGTNNTSSASSSASSTSATSTSASSSTAVAVAATSASSASSSSSAVPTTSSASSTSTSSSASSTSSASPTSSSASSTSSTSPSSTSSSKSSSATPSSTTTSALTTSSASSTSKSSSSSTTLVTSASTSPKTSSSSSYSYTSGAPLPTATNTPSFYIKVSGTGTSADGKYLVVSSGDNGVASFTSTTTSASKFSLNVLGNLEELNPTTGAFLSLPASLSIFSSSATGTFSYGTEFTSYTFGYCTISSSNILGCSFGLLNAASSPVVCSTSSLSWTTSGLLGFFSSSTCPTATLTVVYA